MKIVNSFNSQNNTYIGKDLMGYPYNRKYPPDMKKYGTHYSGYRTFQQECFFYNFAVQHYYVKFRYKGNEYYIVSWEDCCARTDETWSKVLEKFPNEIELIEQLKIDGVRLIDFMNEIEEVEVY